MGENAVSIKLSSFGAKRKIQKMAVEKIISESQFNLVNINFHQANLIRKASLVVI